MMNDTVDFSIMIGKIEEAVASGTPVQLLQLSVDLERLRMLVLSQMVKHSSQELSLGKGTGDPSRLLTIPEVANLLQIPCGRCYELSRQGVLPTMKIGKYIRISQASLHSWLAQQQHMHSPQWGEASQGRDMRGFGHHTKHKESKNDRETEKISGKGSIAL